MTTLSELFQMGYNAYKAFDSQLPQNNPSRCAGLEVKGPTTPSKFQVANNSNYLIPIDQDPSRLAGYGRGWGQAHPSAQFKVMELILNHSKHLSAENQAILLAAARVESGFNPDAASRATSASGVFQLVSQTASSLGLEQNKIFDAEQNVIAGVSLFEENLSTLNKRYPKLSGNERAVMLYALHHDGPSLNFGGDKIARQQIVPFLDDFRAITYQNLFNETY